MLSHFVPQEDWMTTLSEPNITVIVQRVPGGFTLAPLQRAVRPLHVLGCKVPAPPTPCF